MTPKGLGVSLARMDNLKAIDLWKTWNGEHENFAGDVSATESANVDFWFAQNGKDANKIFHCFASGGDGSLLAIYSPEGTFATGPVVHLGNEGDVFVIAKDVPNALALVAASGNSYESAITSDDDLETDDDLASWLKETFSVEIPKSVANVVKGVDSELGKSIKARVTEINGA